MAIEILHDPVEETKEYLAIKDQLESELLKIMADCPYRMGRCHIYWGHKKRLLKEKYNIDWKSPDDMNPGIMFD